MRHPASGSGDVAAFAYQRVDAARALMRTPAIAAASTGRLFFAKRMHERAKAGHAPPQELQRVLDEVLEEVLASAGDERARQGARDEHDLFRRALGT